MAGVSPVSSPETNRDFFFGVRFMRRLSVRVKLWATTGILALPLVGLGVFYVHSLSSTLFFTATEQRGYTLFLPLDAVALRLERREELDAALAAAVAVDVKSGNAATHAQMKELQSEWQSLEGTKFDAPQPSIEAHDKVIDTVGGLTAQIAGDYDLALDPELAAYNLIDVTMTKLPDARRSLLAARAHMVSMYSGGEFAPAEGGHVAASLALLNDRMNSARDEIKTVTTAAADRPALTAEISALNKDWNTGLAGWSDEEARSLPAGHPAEAATRAALSASDNFAQSLNSAQDAVLNAADKSLDLRHHGEARGAAVALCGSVVALTLGIVLMLALSGRISGAVKHLLHISTRITEGEYDNRIDQDGTDEISKLFAGMSTMQQTLAIENGRIRSALDNVSGCVMVADGEWKIIYTNTAVVNMLRAAEVEIRKQLPTFRASTLRRSSLGRAPSGSPSIPCCHRRAYASAPRSNGRIAPANSRSRRKPRTCWTAFSAGICRGASGSTASPASSKPLAAA